jgi:threonine/homoserine/homoserine lactone efflux protein
LLYPTYDFFFMLLYLLQGITYGFAAAVQPGPLQTYLISQTLRNGWRARFRKSWRRF